MATTAPSRTPTEPTLANVLAAIAAAELPKAQRQNLASAVRTVARLLDRPPELVPADPAGLARHCLGVEQGAARDPCLADGRDPAAAAAPDLYAPVVGLSRQPQGRCRCLSRPALRHRPPH